MVFVFAALIVIAWSLATIRWSIARRSSHTPRRAVLTLSLIALPVLVISAFQDAAAIWKEARAPDANVAIVIDEIGDWYRLNYRRGSTNVTTANEIHVPVGRRVSIVWNGSPPFVLRSRDFLVLDREGSRFVASQAGSSEPIVVTLWPPRWRRLRIMAETPDAFERWLARERSAVPYTGASFVFENSGCGFCHVVRGVTESPKNLAPDLTHFGARRFIAGTALPNRYGYLSGWIVNSGALKHGSRMPESALDAATLRTLVTYLESLR